MAEYIDKELAIQTIIDNFTCYFPNVTKAVRKIPAEDVQPIRRGRWIGINEYCKKNGYIPSGMGIYYWCSECGKEEPKISDYCPNCGVRMDGDAE